MELSCSCNFGRRENFVQCDLQVTVWNEDTRYDGFPAMAVGRRGALLAQYKAVLWR